MAIKGSAEGTMKGQDTRPTEMERLAQEGAETARKLLAAFTTSPAAINSNPEETFAPLEEDVRNMPNPKSEPLPSAPSGATLGFGLLATNLASVALRNPQLAQAGLDTAQGKILNREAVQRANIAQENKADASRQAGLLALREKILTQKLEEELANKKAGAADKTSKELFVVQTALAHVTGRLGAREQASLTQGQLVVQERVANMEAKFRFLSSVLGMEKAEAGGGMDAKNEIDEITKLNDFTTSIDLKLNPESGQWGWGKKAPSEEEMAAHVRVVNSYLSSPSQRVRSAALFDLKNMMQAKFGDNQAKKQQFLIEQGLVAKPEGN